MYYYILTAKVPILLDTLYWVKHICVTTCSIFLLVIHYTLVMCYSFNNILIICTDILNLKIEYMEVSNSPEGAYDCNFKKCIICQIIK